MAVNSVDSCSLAVDDSFGPWAASCRGGFDFTLLFEETVLTILPLGLLLVIASFRLMHLRKKKRKVVQSWVLVLKLVKLPSRYPPATVLDVSTYANTI